ncbi:glycerophosphodiester phosphodiesterase [soil metagenome]
MAEDLKGGGKPLRIGHKGADAIVPGNTLESFEAAVDAGVDLIEFDVLRDRNGRLVVAHDYEDALSRRALDLTDALEAFRYEPLDQVEFDCDLKLPGREAELAGVLAGHDLIDRAMISTMEVSSLRKLRQLEPDLRLGWTFPKTRRDWSSQPLLRPALKGALALLRRRFPKAIGERADELGLTSVWAYHQVVSERAVEAAREAGVDLYAWTVDDAARIAELAEMGVDGIVSNDPRLFDGAEPPEEDEDEDEEEDEKKGKAKDEAAS